MLYMYEFLLKQHTKKYYTYISLGKQACFVVLSYSRIIYNFFYKIDSKSTVMNAVLLMTVSMCINKKNKMSNKFKKFFSFWIVLYVCYKKNMLSSVRRLKNDNYLNQRWKIFHFHFTSLIYCNSGLVGEIVECFSWFHDGTSASGKDSY